MDGYFETYVAPVLLGGGIGLVLIHVLGIQTVHPLLLVATVPAMAIGVCGTARHYLPQMGLDVLTSTAEVASAMEREYMRILPTKLGL